VKSREAVEKKKKEEEERRNYVEDKKENIKEANSDKLISYEAHQFIPRKCE